MLTNAYFHSSERGHESEPRMFHVVEVHLRVLAECIVGLPSRGAAVVRVPVVNGRWEVVDSAHVCVD